MTDEWIPALARYAARLHATADGKHHVASPLGAWLLLAMTAAADPPGEDDPLGDVLGVDSGRAVQAAAELLAEPHPLVAAASAIWHSSAVDQQWLTRWLARLPSSVETGPVPDRAGLDRWAREHTYGLIDKFPLDPRPEMMLLLASALATKLSWDVPFEVVAGSELGGDWKLARALRTPEAGHTAFVATTRAAGQVIVHAAPATDATGAEVQVISVAAAADVAPERVIAAAYEVGQDLAAADRTSLFDLALGDAPLWTIREERAAMHAAERVGAVLPAWTATSEHELSGPGLGFDVATRVLGLPEFEARQAATARFSRYGFEAAAVTGFAVLTSVPAERTVRFAELRFAHPYAVVAVTGGGGPWDGVPVFSAWVSEPTDAEE